MWLQPLEHRPEPQLQCFSTLNGLDVVATDSHIDDCPYTKQFQYPQRAGCGCNLKAQDKVNVDQGFSTLNGLDVVATR